jgi:peptidoglycan biosynthesis protein MviN/MurJ (putative lipid II flippase)
MKKTLRIALNVLGPPPLAVAFIVVGEGLTNALTSDRKIFPNANWLLLMLIVAYLIAILPSILHAIYLEWIYEREPEHTWRAVGFSCLSGLTSGAIIALVLMDPESSNRAEPLIFISLGLLVGACTGIIVKLSSRPPRAY